MKGWVLLIALAVAMLLVGLACGESRDPGSAELPTSTAAPLVGGGHGGEPYESPILHAEGDWIPPAFVPYTQETIREDWERVQGAPLVSGEERISGFRFYRGGDTQYEQVTPLCDLDKAPLNSAAGEASLPFTVNYLPPTTVEEIYPRTRHCEDGTLLAAVRTFTIGPSSLYISFIAGEKAIDFLPFAEKVKNITIHGEAGVLVEPMAFGSGPSLIAWPYKNGYMRVDGNSIPLDELLKTAEGVSTLK